MPKKEQKTLYEEMCTITNIVVQRNTLQCFKDILEKIYISDEEYDKQSAKAVRRHEKSEMTAKYDTEVFKNMGFFVYFRDMPKDPLLPPEVLRASEALTNANCVLYKKGAGEYLIIDLDMLLKMTEASHIVTHEGHDNTLSSTDFTVIAVDRPASRKALEQSVADVVAPPKM